jgi:hypothetical protein
MAFDQIKALSSQPTIPEGSSDYGEVIARRFAKTSRVA